MDSSTILHGVGAYIGDEASTMDVSALLAAIDTAADTLKLDFLCVKVIDGTICYQSYDAWDTLRAHALEKGLGLIGLQYCYGLRFGEPQLDEAMALANAMLQKNGSHVLDCEVEMNGDTVAAQRIASDLKDHSGVLVLSTWADPAQQNWLQNLSILRSVVNLFSPQFYNNYLENTWIVDLPALAPAVDLTQGFGPNAPAAIAQHFKEQGATSLWLWDYFYCLQYPGIFADIINAWKPGTVAPPHPSMYTIAPGDTLTSIANAFHTAPYPFLYTRNAATLDRIARLHGYPSSYRGNLIFPNTQIFLS